jgi:hypothetical protein
MRMFYTEAQNTTLHARQRPRQVASRLDAPAGPGSSMFIKSMLHGKGAGSRSLRPSCQDKAGLTARHLRLVGLVLARLGGLLEVHAEVARLVVGHEQRQPLRLGVSPMSVRCAVRTEAIGLTSETAPTRRHGK